MTRNLETKQVIFYEKYLVWNFGAKKTSKFDTTFFSWQHKEHSNDLIKHFRDFPNLLLCLDSASHNFLALKPVFHLFENSEKV